MSRPALADANARPGRPLRSCAALDIRWAVSDRKAIDQALEQLFDAERTARKIHDELAAKPRDEMLDALSDAVQASLRETREEEASLRLVRLAGLLGEFEGPRVVDGLIDVLGADHPEARATAGEHLEDLAFDRFKEVALGVERALKRLPVGSPALSELPYVLVEVPEPGVAKLLGMFLQHEDADAVAAAIEVLTEIGDPSSQKLLEPLLEDTRTVELAEGGSADATEEITIGELASEAIALFSAMGEDQDEDDEGDGDDDEDEPSGKASSP